MSAHSRCAVPPGPVHSREGARSVPLVFRGLVAPLQGRRGLDAELPKARPATGVGAARQVALALGGVSGHQRRRGFPEAGSCEKAACLPSLDDGLCARMAKAQRAVPGQGQPCLPAGQVEALARTERPVGISLVLQKNSLPAVPFGRGAWTSCIELD